MKMTLAQEDKARSSLITKRSYQICRSGWAFGLWPGQQKNASRSSRKGIKKHAFICRQSFRSYL